MKLYHFCSRRHVESIRSEGLTLGSIPLCDFKGDPVRLLRGFQWLTKNKSWEQSWDSESSLEYDRNDYRIQVAIPKDRRDRLFEWVKLCNSNKSLIFTARTLNSFGDPENWYLFKGRIKPGWFRGIDSHPGRPQLSTLK